MLAMVVNDNAGHLAHRSVLRSIASNRASTGCSYRGPALDDIFALKHRTVGAGLLAITAVNPPPPLLARHNGSLTPGGVYDRYPPDTDKYLTLIEFLSTPSGCNFSLSRYNGAARRQAGVVMVTPSVPPQRSAVNPVRPGREQPQR